MQEGTLEKAQTQKQSATSAVLIANPTSGSYIFHAQQIKETITFLQRHGWDAELRLTQASSDVRRFTREAIEDGVDMVVAVGGDGTINEIIQELAGSETALGVLPSGTVNVWAREVGIPLDNFGARSVLLNGQVRSIDLGQVDGRYFLLMAGIGFDGEVIYAVEKKPAKRFGVLGYLLVGAWLGLGYTDFRSYLQLDERSIKMNALQVIIGNTQLYGGAIKYTWQAKCDDGLLDVCIVPKQGMLKRIFLPMVLLFQRKQRRQLVRYEQCKTIKIHTKKPIAIQLDGEPIGYTSSSSEAPTTFTIAPRILKVIVPQKPPEGLFCED